MTNASASKLATQLRAEAARLIEDAGARQRALEACGVALGVDTRSASGAQRAQELAAVLGTTASVLERA